MFGLNMGTILTFGLGVVFGLYLGNKEFRAKVNNMLDGLLKKKVDKNVPPTVHTTSTDTKKGE